VIGETETVGIFTLDSSHVSTSIGKTIRPRLARFAISKHEIAEMCTGSVSSGRRAGSLSVDGERTHQTMTWVSARSLRRVPLLERLDDVTDDLSAERAQFLE
jgi:hypothetical protein